MKHGHPAIISGRPAEPEDRGYLIPSATRCRTRDHARFSEADQDLARAITAVEPNARAFARANREFLGRAVRFLGAAGIGQFLDIGSGIPTEGNENTTAIQADLRDPGLAPGSYLAIGHATNEGNPQVAQAFEKVYNRRVPTQVNVRSRAEILRFFDGFDLVDPGLVYIPWRLDSPGDVPADPGKFWGELVGVARKP
jgi:S-adenosyl methyltransferase